jgi:hypothetical protein
MAGLPDLNTGRVFSSRMPVYPKNLGNGVGCLAPGADLDALGESAKDGAGRPHRCPKPRCPMAWDIGTRLIEPKTPLRRRFDLLALILPNRTNNALTGRPNPKAASLGAANPEQVGNLANGMAFPE